MGKGHTRKCHFYWIILFDFEFINQFIKVITTFVMKKIGIQNNIFIFVYFLCFENKSTSRDLEIFFLLDISTKFNKLSTSKLFNIVCFTSFNLIPNIFN